MCSYNFKLTSVCLLTLLLVVNVLCWRVCFIWASCPDSLSPDNHFLLMERLREIGLDPNSTRFECLDLLSTQSTDVLLNLRSALFLECHESDLLHQGDEIVSRRVTHTGKSLSVKLSEDICSLIISLNNQTAVARTLLKMANGISRILTHHVLEIYRLLNSCLSALFLPLTILHLAVLQLLYLLHLLLYLLLLQPLFNKQLFAV